MSKGNTFENEILEHIFNNADITLIGDAGGVLGSVADGNLYISLHTADPGEGGNQTTNETAYGSYARVAMARDGTAWVVTADTVNPIVDIVFPLISSGSGTITHFIIGTDISGAGKALYIGTVTPNITITIGISPTLTNGSNVVED